MKTLRTFTLCLASLLVSIAPSNAQSSCDQFHDPQTVELPSGQQPLAITTDADGNRYIYGAYYNDDLVLQGDTFGFVEPYFETLRRCFYVAKLDSTGGLIWMERLWGGLFDPFHGHFGNSNRAYWPELRLRGDSVLTLAGIAGHVYMAFSFIEYADSTMFYENLASWEYETKGFLLDIDAHTGQPTGISVNKYCVFSDMIPTDDGGLLVSGAGIGPYLEFYDLDTSFTHPIRFLAKVNADTQVQWITFDTMGSDVYAMQPNRRVTSMIWHESTGNIYTAGSTVGNYSWAQGFYDHTGHIRVHNSTGALLTYKNFTSSTNAEVVAFEHFDAGGFIVAVDFDSNVTYDSQTWTCASGRALLILKLNDTLGVEWSKLECHAGGVIHVSDGDVDGDRFVLSGHYEGTIQQNGNTYSATQQALWMMIADLDGNVEALEALNASGSINRNRADRVALRETEAIIHGSFQGKLNIGGQTLEYAPVTNYTLPNQLLLVDYGNGLKSDAGPDVILCGNRDTAQLQASTAFAQGHYWQGNNAWLSDNGLQPNVHATESAWLKLHAYSNCGQVKLDSVFVAVDSTYSFDADTVGATVQFQTASPDSCHMPHWTFGDGTSTRGHNPTHTYQTSGYYEVCQSCKQECTFCQTIYVDVSGTGPADTIDTIIGIWESPEPGFQLFPNPVQNELHIVGQGSYRVMTANGMLVDQFAVMGRERTLDVSHWTAGIYFISRVEEPGNVQKLVRH